MAVETASGKCCGGSKRANAASRACAGGGGGAGAGNGGAGCRRRGTGAGGGEFSAIDESLAFLDDWATDEPEQLLFRTDADDNMTAMWNMDSIDVASTFAGEPDPSIAMHARHSSSSNANMSGHTMSTGDASLMAQLSWWGGDHQSAAVVVVGEDDSKRLKQEELPHPSMSPLAVPVKQVVMQRSC
uniref:Uncharacterized protein n=1 Tax=Globisporangium ultimum (strain ATCC 200006 / CBS 805.95 / DAOM BR144) TaxID=431595 RepID=K3WXB4_GLOUD